MTYEIIFTKRAVKDLKKLDEKIKEKIIENLKEYKKNPLVYAIKLTNPKIGHIDIKSEIIGWFSIWRIRR